MLCFRTKMVVKKGSKRKLNQKPGNKHQKQDKVQKVTAKPIEDDDITSESDTEMNKDDGYKQVQK